MSTTNTAPSETDTIQHTVNLVNSTVTYWCYAVRVLDESTVYYSRFKLDSEKELYWDVRPDWKIIRYSSEGYARLTIHDLTGEIVASETFIFRRDRPGKLFLAKLKPGEYIAVLVLRAVFTRSLRAHFTSMIVDSDDNIVQPLGVEVRVGKYKLTIIPSQLVEPKTELCTVSDNPEFTYQLRATPVFQPKEPTTIPFTIIVEYYDEELGDTVTWSKKVNVGFYPADVDVDVRLEREPDTVYWIREDNTYAPRAPNTLTGYVKGKTPFPVNATVEVHIPPGVTVEDYYGGQLNNRILTVTAENLRGVSSSDNQVYKDLGIRFRVNAIGRYVFLVRKTIGDKIEEEIHEHNVFGYKGPLAVWVLAPEIVPEGSSVRLKIVLYNRTEPLAATVEVDSSLSRYGENGRVLIIYLDNGYPPAKKALIRVLRKE